MNNMILVETLRHEPGSELAYVVDASKHIHNIREINFEEEFPMHRPRNTSIWIIGNSADYKRWIVNLKSTNLPVYEAGFASDTVHNNILQIVKQHIRDNKLNEIGI
jgi:hypothetical protein